MKSSSSLEHTRREKPVLSAQRMAIWLCFHPVHPSSSSCSRADLLALAVSAPPLATGLPSNEGLEQSEQGQSDSGSRLADDLLAGLESSEPRQLKWSLKLEPTCWEGGEGASKRKKTEGKRGTEGQHVLSSSMETYGLCK